MAAPAAAEPKVPWKKVATDEELEAKLAGPGLKGDQCFGTLVMHALLDCSRAFPNARIELLSLQFLYEHGRVSGDPFHALE